MTNHMEPGLSMETDKVLELTRENARLRKLCVMSRTTIEMFMGGSAVKHPHIKLMGQLTIDEINSELESETTGE